MTVIEKSNGRENGPCEIHVVCESSILSVKQIIGWIVSITISVVIVIGCVWIIVIGPIKRCPIYDGPGVARPGVCGSVTTIINNISIQVSNTIINYLEQNVIIIQTKQKQRSDAAGAGTLGQNPFGMNNTGGQFPLALGGDKVLIEIEDSAKSVPHPANPGQNVPAESTRPGCSAPVIGIEVDSDDDNFDDQLLGQRDGEARTDKSKWREQDLDFPPFCEFPPASDGRRTYWSLLEQPRVHFTRTYVKLKPGTGLPAQPPSGNTDADKRAHPEDVADQPPQIYYQTGAPYAVFTAQQYGNPKLLKVFVLYVDFVTERPTIIEIPFESLRGGNIVHADGVVHLVNNIKLDSINHELTFQIGSGVRELTIAGYDFGPESTDTADIDIRNEDASGSFVACLTPDGGIYRVFRIDRDVRLNAGKRKCEIYR